nr:exo-beta-N-acetylmuramidase NamZ domain-containing protein [Nitrospirillum iridis]
MRHGARALLCVLLLAAVPVQARAAGPALAPMTAAIDAAVQEEIAARHMPGAVVLVGGRDGTFYRNAWGLRRVQPDTAPMTVDTVFDLASLTKVLVTTTAVMQLVEKGTLRLEAPVSRYWPAFATHGKAGITIGMLLTHTSGLRADLDLTHSWTGAAAARARLLMETPTSAPGERFRYSDLDFMVLGEVVQRVSGLSLAPYAARHIFRPLRMADTGFLPRPDLRSRIAPTNVQEGRLRWGQVNDPTAYRMGGVAGHAGVFGTADDLARFARMLLNGGALEKRRLLKASSVALMTSPHVLPGGVVRGLGWDMASPYAGGQDTAFGPASYGHTGYTGTSLWIDPERGCYLIILTSRLHPADQGDARPLRRRLAEAVAAAWAPPVRTGIDVLAGQGFAPLAGKRVALLTNQTGVDRHGRRTADLLARAPDVRLALLLSPEHGPQGDREGRIASGVDASTGVPILSLYGANRRPPPEALAGLDAIVIDIQDAGVRFYTYATTMAYVLEAAATARIPVHVLDRPNPITATAVQGPVLDADRLSFTGYFPLPVRHGMTLGELALLFNGENGIGAALTVTPVNGYRRDSWYDETGLRWVNPSPNLRSVDEAALYPGVALVEGSAVSVGRGTPTPFEVVGAPWIDGAALADLLGARAIPGVRFAATTFIPTADRHAGVPCHGVRLMVTDRAALDSPLLGIELAAALYRLYPERFHLDDTLGLIGSKATVEAIRSGIDPRAIAAGWETDLAAFKALRAKYLLYP